MLARVCALRLQLRLASPKTPKLFESTHTEQPRCTRRPWPSTPAGAATRAPAPSPCPIYQTTAFQFDSSEHAADLFALKELGNIYTRIMNPTADALEKRVAAMEGGVAALAVASGQAASALAVQNLARAGDNIVSSTDLYGGTWNLFANTLKDMGIEVRFVDPADPEAFVRASDDRTRAWYAETLPNPKLRVFPIAEVAALGRPMGIPLIMDNTAAPMLVRAVRPWRRGDRVFRHQIPRRPRHGDRRRDRGWRQLRLGGAPGAAPGAEHAGPVLSRRGLDGGGEAAGPGRLHPEGAGDPAAGPWPGDQPVQRMAGAAGNGDAAAADEAPLRDDADGRELAGQAAGSGARDPSRRT